MRKPHLIVFTDLDGTLLEFKTYSYEKALPMIERLKLHSIPIVFCSHKTRAEQSVFRDKLGISDPFIVENGGAIVIPNNYFEFNFEYHRTVAGYKLIELGLPYESIRATLKRIETELGMAIKGFGDMSAEEVAKDSGLPIEFARLAKQREYDETFKLDYDNDKDKARILRAIEASGLKWTHGGRYYSIMGSYNDKGRAVKILTELFRKKFDVIQTIGIGDSLNDLPMLQEVDLAYLVQKPNGTWEELELSNLTKVESIGPEGWCKVINWWLKNSI
jgi:mannosyl-3-phosphoglycerate phosphatase